MADGLDIDLYADDLEPDFNQENEFNHDQNVDLYDDVITAPSGDGHSGDEYGLGHDDSPPHSSSSGMGDPMHHSGNGKRVCIYVGNLTWWTTDQDVTDAINALGVNDVLDIKFYENRANGQSKGFCVVTLGSENSFRTVMEKLPRKELHGQNPAVTSCSRQNLNHFEMLSSKRNQGMGRNSSGYNGGPGAGPSGPGVGLHNMAGMGRLGGPPGGALARGRGGHFPPTRPPPNQGPPHPYSPGPRSWSSNPPPMHHNQHHPVHHGPPPPRPGGPPGLPGGPPPHRMQGPPPPRPLGPPPLRLPLPPRGPPPIMRSRGPPPDPRNGPPPEWDRPPVGHPPPPGPPPPMQSGGLSRPPPHNGPPPNLPPVGPPPSHPPAPHVNPAFFPPHQGPPPGPPPVSQQDPYGRPPPSQYGDYRGPPPDRHDNPPISEAEFEEIMGRNRTVSSSAISRAVADASAGDYASSIETLVTAISLIKQSKVANDERCKILISSLQDTLHGIESKSYGSRKDRGRSRERSRERSSRREKSSRRSRSRERDYRDRSRERDRYHEERYREKERDRDREREHRSSRH